MKITHVIWSLLYGGAETMLVQMLNIQCIKNEVSLIIVNESIEDSLIAQIDKKIVIFRINRPRESKNPFFFLKLSRLLLFLPSDIVHFHQDNLIEYIPIRFFKKNFCLTVHCVTMDVKSIYKYNYLFAISKSVQEQIKENCQLNSILIYNGINIREFNTNKKEKAEKDKFKIVQIGRLAHLHKGQDLLIKAASLLIKKYHYTNFSIQLLGEGDSFSYLSLLIEQLQLSDYVSLEGNKSFDFIRTNLCNFDLLVQPSRYEGFGLVAIEGIAAKIPVLVSDVDGLAEIIQPAKIGYSSKKEDVEDLAEKIWKIINEPQEKLDMLTEKAYEYVKENFDISNTSEAYLQAYSQIADTLRK